MGHRWTYSLHIFGSPKLGCLKPCDHSLATSSGSEGLSIRSIVLHSVACMGFLTTFLYTGSFRSEAWSTVCKYVIQWLQIEFIIAHWSIQWINHNNKTLYILVVRRMTGYHQTSVLQLYSPNLCISHPISLNILPPHNTLAFDIFSLTGVLLVAVMSIM